MIKNKLTQEIPGGMFIRKIKGEITNESELTFKILYVHVL